MTSTELCQQVSDAIARFRFRFSNEDELQQGIAAALDRANIVNYREVRITPQDRLDLLTLTGIAIETKIDGSFANLVRQLARYSEHENVKGIVVVTNRAKHLSLPGILNGKPVMVCSLIVGAL